MTEDSAAGSVPRTTIEADPDLPIVRISREFAATPEQIVRAHTDPDVFVRWIGPADMTSVVDRWQAGTGGHYRYLMRRDGQEEAFYGSFHYVGPDRVVQTFTWEGQPEGVSLDTMVLRDLGDGRTLMVSTSLMESMEARDAMLASGMEVGVEQGYAKLDALLARGEL